MEAMDVARQAKAEEDTWPKVHYLWPQDPISEWLGDRVISEFRGHRAPVLRSPKLAPGEMAFVIAGTVPNRKGQPVVVDWQAVTRGPDGQFRLEPFETFAVRAGLKAGTLPNAAQAVPDAVQQALPEAVSRMRKHMIQAQQEFAAGNQAALQQALRDLDQLRGKQDAQLDLAFADLGPAAQSRAAKAAARKQELDQEFQAYQGWIRDTMETEPEPFLQVIAAVCSVEAG